jgi:hypothetical protein
MKDHITIEGHDGAFATYIARPKTLPAPAVVVLRELFGVNADIRKTCDELAEQGFLAVAPDLFWRQEPGVDLNVTSEANWQHGVRLYGAYDRDAGAKDVKDTVTQYATSRSPTARSPSSAFAVQLLPVQIAEERACSCRECNHERRLFINRFTGSRRSMLAKASISIAPRWPDGSGHQ